jgi:hypothetical protein
MKKEEQKQHLIDMMRDDENLGLYDGFKQETRMYTEEDMEEAFENGLKRSFDSDFDRWFEQFKKKYHDTKRKSTRIS